MSLKQIHELTKEWEAKGIERKKLLHEQRTLKKEKPNGNQAKQTV